MNESFDTLGWAYLLLRFDYSRNTNILNTAHYPAWNLQTVFHFSCFHCICIETNDESNWRHKVYSLTPLFFIRLFFFIWWSKNFMVCMCITHACGDAAVNIKLHDTMTVSAGTRSCISITEIITGRINPTNNPAKSSFISIAHTQSFHLCLILSMSICLRQSGYM